MLVDVEVDALQNLTVYVANPGTGYQIGDTVTFKDQQLSAIGGDLVLTIANKAQATFSTRKLNVAATESDGNSGEILFKADHILLTEGAKLFADKMGTGS